MLFASSSFAPELQPLNRGLVHVLPAYSLYCDRAFADHLAFWTPGETELEPHAAGTPTVIELPADRAVISRAPGPSLCFARPALIPRLFGAAALPLDPGVVPPPRIAADLAMEQGFAVRSATVRVLNEDLEDYGGAVRVGVLESGDSRLYALVKETNPTGGRQSWDQPRFLWQAIGARHATATAAVSLAGVLGDSYRLALPSPRSRFRLRLIASIEQPWAWNEWLTVWNQWSQELDQAGAR